MDVLQKAVKALIGGYSCSESAESGINKAKSGYVGANSARDPGIGEHSIRVNVYTALRGSGSRAAVAVSWAFRASRRIS